MNIQSNKVVPAVAIAVAVACGTAGAASLNSPPQFRLTNEYLVAQAAANPNHVSTLQVIPIKIDSTNYANDTTVKLTIGGATVTTASAITSVSCYQDGGVGSTSVGMILTYASLSNNVISFTVDKRSLSTAISATNLICSVPAGTISVLTSSIAQNSKITVDFAGAYSGGTVFDKLTDSGSATGFGPNTIGNSFPQFYTLQTSVTRDPLVPGSLIGGTGSKQKGLAQTVNVDAPTRFTVASGTDEYSTATAWDIFTFTTRNEGAVGGNARLATAAGNQNSRLDAGTRTVTISGNFNFLDDDNNGCTSADMTSGPTKMIILQDPQYSGTSATTTINSTCSTVTYSETYDPSTASAELTNRVLFTIEGGDPGTTPTATSGVSAASVRSRAGTTLPVGTNFQADTAFLSGSTTYGSANGVATSWKNNAASTTSATVQIPYLPYGTGISRVVYVTNTSTTVGGVASFKAIKEDGTTCSSTNFSSVSVPANAVTLLTGAIDAGLAACGVSASTPGKAAVTVTVTPSVSGKSLEAGFSKQIVVTSNYNVANDRVNIINSTN